MKTLLFFCSLFLSVTFYAQNSDQKQILSDSKALVEYMQMRDYDKMLDLTHPEMLKKFKKEDIVTLLKTTLEGNGLFKIELDAVPDSQIRVSEIFTSGNGGRYAFVTYPISMKMTFAEQKFDAEQKNLMSSMMAAEGLEVTFLNDQSLLTKTTSLSVALKDKTTGNKWKYVNQNAKNPLYNSIVSAEIREKAAEYREIASKNSKNAD